MRALTGNSGYTSGIGWLTDFTLWCRVGEQNCSLQRVLQEKQNYQDFLEVPTSTLGSSQADSSISTETISFCLSIKAMWEGVGTQKATDTTVP